MTAPRRHRRVSRVRAGWSAVLDRFWPWGLAAAGAWIAGLNQWKLVMGFGAGYHDYGLVRGMTVSTALGDSVPFRYPEDGISFLAQHFLPIMYPFVAAYQWIPTEHLYAWSLGAAWYAGVLLTGVLAWRLTGRRGWAVALAAVMFFDPDSRRVFFSAQWMVFQVPLILLAALAWFAGRPGWFAACAIAACLVREDVPLYVACLAGWFALTAEQARPRRLAVIVAASALAYFVITTRWLMPSFQPPGSAGVFAGMLDSRWCRGDSVAEIAGHLARHPWEPLVALAGKPSLLAVAGFGFLCVLRPGYFLMVCAPPMLIMALSCVPDYTRFRYYIASGFLAQLAIGAALGLARLQAVRPARRGIVIGRVLLGAAIVFGLSRPAPEGRPRTRLPIGLTAAGAPWPVTPEDREVSRRLNALDPGNHVIAGGFATVVHLPVRVQPRWMAFWRRDRPDWIVYDERRDEPETSLVLGIKDGPRGIHRMLVAAGYRATPIHDTCRLYIRDRQRRSAIE